MVMGDTEVDLRRDFLRAEKDFSRRDAQRIKNDQSFHFFSAPLREIFFLEQAMKPWREVAAPYADVLKGTFQPV